MATVPSNTRFIGISPSVNLTERKAAIINAETQPFTMQDITDTVGVGSAGPQGVQGPVGPAGALGPVGPAGLNWQGSWVSGTSYVADDAVGYDGASYFCILATSGTTNPSVTPLNWALLASQGATGATGATGLQGPTGAQGPSGGAGTLQQTVNNGNTVTTGSTNLILTGNSLSILNTTTSVGNVLLRDSLRFLRDNGSGTNNRIDLSPPFNITNNRTITLPDASGTVALKTYNETVILLSYDGTSFTYTNVINELGVTITFSTFSGTIVGTLSSSVLTEDKTIVWASSFVEFGGYLTKASRNNGTSFSLQLTNTNGTNNSIPTSFTNLPIRIQVYN